MSSHPRRGRWLRGGLAAAAAPAALISMLSLPACGSLFQNKEPPQSVYLLTVAPVDAGAAMSGDLTILRPRVRPGLDTAFIAALYPDRRLDHFAGARWSGPLDEVMEDLAVQAFRADAHAQNVHSYIASFGTGYWLEMDVVDFQAEYGGSGGGSGGGSAGGLGGGSSPPAVHVHLVARLGASGDRHVLGQFEAEVREPAADNRLTAIVDAYNRAVSAALGKIVVETREALGRS